VAKKYNTLIGCFDESVIRHIQFLNVEYGNTVHWPLQGLENSKEFKAASISCKIRVLNDIAKEVIKDTCKYYYTIVDFLDKTTVPERIKTHHNRELLLEEVKKMCTNSTLNEVELADVSTAAINQ
jgi:hypothetical protein